MFNIHLTTHLYAQDHLPLEDFMTHTLNAQDADQRKVILRQKGSRFGIGKYMYPEQFFHRYFGHKYGPYKTHSSPGELQNDAIGTELYFGVPAAGWAY